MPVTWPLAKKFNMIHPLIFENIRIALNSIRTHLLRTTLTVLIIAFGIMALVGILTAIDSIKYYLNDNFSMMGANSFTIRSRTMRIHIGGNNNQPRNFPHITYDQAMAFKDEYTYPAIPSVSVFASGATTIKFRSEKTNPNVAVMGGDENYLITSGNNLSRGRNFSQHELICGSSVVILGNEVYNKLFKGKEDPVGQIVSIGPGSYRVVGVLKEKGSSMAFTGDRACIIPLSNVRQRFSRPNMSFSITVMANKTIDLEPAIGEATGIFRKIRKVPLGQESDFDISKSDNIAEMLIDNIRYVTLAATIIGFITLLGAAIGLMNIMLVSVTERTREIGIRKAIGATRSTIRNQFLVEAIVIGQIGGLFGIILGIGIGNILSLIIGSSFIIPWAWIVLGVVLCFFVAVISGIYPAFKASNLSPIESLRYE
jgi:putative ABC transport system permease protein